MRSGSAFVALLLACAGAVQAQTVCPPATLWEPYSESCADVRDVRDQFLPPLAKTTTAISDAPVPGTMSAGTAYAAGQLVALESGRLHTKMFVHPDGLDHQDPLPTWLYTTATSRVHQGLEVVGMYAEFRATGILGLFAWTCLPDYPCPDGATSPGWQWSRPMPELTCNVTQVVDQGGHAQKQLYYANHSDRLDDGSPPQWKSAVYLWNYCDKAWDLAWEHLYRADKLDCSIAGSGCAWWGPSFEIFGDEVYPAIGELGYEDSLLYHDGVWSRLLPPEADFRDPADPRWGALTPWQLFHLEPNRSYGAGSWVNDNDAPVIEAQAPLWTPQGESLLIGTDSLTISDPDVDPAYHVEFRLTLYGGDNYSYTDNELTPDAGFTGELLVPVSVSDGAAESNTYQLRVEVLADNETPVIQGQRDLSVLEDQTLTITVGDLVVVDPDSDPSALSLQLYAGSNYTFTGTAVTPAADYAGELQVPVTVSDGQATSEKYSLLITVVAVNDAPAIVGQRALATPELTALELTIDDFVIDDPDSAAAELAISVLDGIGYERAGNTITPQPGVTGNLEVGVMANDGSSNSDIFIAVVQVTADTVPPQITLLGAASVTLRTGSIYVDAGATATDNVDGDITDRIVVDNPVNTSLAGTYTVTYTVADLAGNTATATRTVVVQAATAPSGGGGGAISVWMLVLLVVGRSVAGRRSRF